MAIERADASNVDSFGDVQRSTESNWAIGVHLSNREMTCCCCSKLRVIRILIDNQDLGSNGVVMVVTAHVLAV